MLKKFLKSTAIEPLTIILNKVRVTVVFGAFLKFKLC
jgi:hypothetical protein